MKHIKYAKVYLSVDVFLIIVFVVLFVLFRDDEYYDWQVQPAGAAAGHAVAGGQCAALRSAGRAVRFRGEIFELSYIYIGYINFSIFYIF